MTSARLAACLIAGALALTACSKPTPAGAASGLVLPAAAGEASAPTGAFPAGVQLGELGLPIYPTPPEQIVAHEPEPNGDGGVSTTTSMDPHVPFATVVEWYKAHMPAGAYQPGGRDDYAMFQIGKDGEKLIRIVIVQHVAGHVQTDISLVRKTFP